nr:MAG TPA: hypothetical protein [Caudoviricetes sp.]
MTPLFSCLDIWFIIIIAQQDEKCNTIYMDICCEIICTFVGTINRTSNIDKNLTMG